MANFPRSLALVCATIVFFAGCSQGLVHEGLPALVPCSITVMQDGRPLEDAIVTLTPKEGSTNWVVGGRTDAKGVAKIQTQMRYPGAPAGDYKVRVAKTVTEYGTPIPSGSDLADVTPSTTFTLIPLKFDDVNATPCEITISGSSSTATVDVGAAVREQVK